jgi:hypothetical protein
MIVIAAAAGCSAPATNAPSLAPRAAEAIDPRAPVPAGVDTRPVEPALAARLAQLVAEANGGNDAFRSAAAEAQRLAAAAGTPQSESWIAAQQALSAAVAARAPTTRALGDIDEAAAVALKARGDLSPADLAAVEAAAGEVAALDRVQAQMIEALQARLGS